MSLPVLNVVFAGNRMKKDRRGENDELNGKNQSI